MLQFCYNRQSMCRQILGIGIKRRKTYIAKSNYDREGFSIYFLSFFFFCRCVSSCSIWNEIFKNQKALDEMSLFRRRKNFRVSMSFFLLFLLSVRSKCRVCVRTAKKNSFLTTVCLTRTVMEFCDYIEIDMFVWQVLYAARSLPRSLCVGSNRDNLANTRSR